MLRITCPYCGVRDQDEFRFGGEAPVIRPQDPKQATDNEWAEYLFYKNNRKGPQLERWLHAFGCGQWFLVRRDTLTHEISEVCKMNEPSVNG